MSTDHERESDPPPKRGRFPVVLVVFFAGTLAGMLACGGIGTVVVFWQMERARAAEEAAKRAERDAKDVALEAELQSMEAAGLTQDQLKQPMTRTWFSVILAHDRALLGKPDAIEESDGETRWVYVGRTINPETKKRDRRAIVRFRDGKGADVTFE